MFLDDFLAEDAYLALSKIRGGLAVAGICGKTFWVDSSSSEAGDTVGRGSFRAPFATLSYAITQTVANRGDTILLKPGHTESLTSSGIDLDVDGLSVVGLGWTTFRPTFTIADTDDEGFILSGEACRLENVIVYVTQQMDTSGLCLYVTGNGCVIKDVKVYGDSIGYMPGSKLVYVNHADDVSLLGLDLHFDADIQNTDTNQFDYGFYLTTSNRCRIKNCYLAGNVRVSCVFASDSVHGLEVTGNILLGYYGHAASDPAWVDTGTGTSYGVIANNVGYSAQSSDTASDLQTVIDNGVVAVCENYVQNAADECGGLAGAPAST